MKYPKLTPRLQTIAKQISPHSIIADIGTDHAYLPVYLITTGKIQKAIASDIRQGPLDSARRTADKYQVSDKLSFRLGSGLHTVSGKECNTIVIAGMGGENIRDILKAALWTQEGKHTLYLQPMSMIQELRYYLLNHSYQIEEEYVCRENNRQYIIIKCLGFGSNCINYTPFWQCILTPALLKAEGSKIYLEREQKRIKKILMGVQQSGHADDDQYVMLQKTENYIQEFIKEAK